MATGGTGNRLEALEKVVEDLASVFQEFQASQVSSVARQTVDVARQAAMDAKLDALLKKLSFTDRPSVKYVYKKRGKGGNMNAIALVLEGQKSSSDRDEWAIDVLDSTIVTSLYQIVYGRPVPTLLRFTIGETKVEAIARELLDRDEALRQLKAHLLRAQGYMKSQADKKRKDKHFEFGECVFVKLRPHRQQSVVQRINPKLSPRFYGPFEIIERIGAVAYKLRLPLSSRIHPVFHISLLKKAIGDYNVEKELPENLAGEVPHTAEPNSIMAPRTIQQHGDTMKQYLVQWQGKPAEEATWEDEFTLVNQFPAFNLADKVVPQAGGIDKAHSKHWAATHDNIIGPKMWKSM
ncbi:hypothetical protein OROGR_029778 [Orobanche gracilis]